MFIIRKRYDAKEYNSNLTESSDNKLMNGWNSVVELNMNTNDEMEMIKRMKNRYETVLICVALALGCDASQHNEEMSRDRSEGLLLKMWEILTQYSKFVLNTVDMITGLIYSHLLLLYFKKSLVLIHRLFILCLLSYLSTFSLILLCLWQWRHIVCS